LVDPVPAEPPASSLESSGKQVESKYKIYDEIIQTSKTNIARMQLAIAASLGEINDEVVHPELVDLSVTETSIAQCVAIVEGVEAMKVKELMEEDPELVRKLSELSPEELEKKGLANQELIRSMAKQIAKDIGTDLPKEIADESQNRLKLALDKVQRRDLKPASQPFRKVKKSTKANKNAIRIGQGETCEVPTEGKHGYDQAKGIYCLGVIQKSLSHGKLTPNAMRCLTEIIEGSEGRKTAKIMAALLLDLQEYGMELYGEVPEHEMDTVRGHRYGLTICQGELSHEPPRSVQQTVHYTQTHGGYTNAQGVSFRVALCLNEERLDYCVDQSGRFTRQGDALTFAIEAKIQLFFQILHKRCVRDVKVQVHRVQNKRAIFKQFEKHINSSYTAAKLKPTSEEAEIFFADAINTFPEPETITDEVRQSVVDWSLNELDCPTVKDQIKEVQAELETMFEQTYRFKYGHGIDGVPEGTSVVSWVPPVSGLTWIILARILNGHIPSSLTGLIDGIPEDLMMHWMMATLAGKGFSYHQIKEGEEKGKWAFEMEDLPESVRLRREKAHRHVLYQDLSLKKDCIDVLDHHGEVPSDMFTRRYAIRSDTPHQCQVALGRGRQQRIAGEAPPVYTKQLPSVTTDPGTWLLVHVKEAVNGRITGYF